MKPLLLSASSILVVTMLLAGCNNSKNQNFDGPMWLLTYDSVINLHHQLSDQFQNDSTLFDEKEKLLFREIQTKWNELQEQRSLMMSEPEAFDSVDSDSLESPLEQFMKKVQNLNSAYQSLAYVMKGIPGRATTDTMLQRSIRKQQYLIDELNTDTLSSINLSELISPAEVVTLYLENCGDCHGKKGEGSSDVYPPLDNTSIAARNKETFIKLVLQGLEGPVVVGGRRYDGAMPSFRASLSDPQIAALLKYVQDMAGASYTPIETNDVKKIADETSTMTEPFTSSELNLNH